MANRNENNPTQAWADFAASGRVEDYLRYRAAENRADAAAGVTGGGLAYTYDNSRAGAARRRNQRKRPPDHGAY